MRRESLRRRLIVAQIQRRFDTTAGTGVESLPRTNEPARKAWDMKVRDAIRLIEAEEWYLVRIKGSHRQFRHPSRRGLVTVPGHPNDDLAPGTLNSILKQAGLKP